MNLGDMVIARTGDGEQEGRIVGRTLEGNAKYDVLTDLGILINIQQIMCSQRHRPPSQRHWLRPRRPMSVNHQGRFIVQQLRQQNKRLEYASVVLGGVLAATVFILIVTFLLVL